MHYKGSKIYEFRSCVVFNSQTSLSEEKLLKDKKIGGGRYGKFNKVWY